MGRYEDDDFVGVRRDCMYDDSDEDCNKCVKHGYIFGCAGCDDYKSAYGRKAEN